MPTAVIVAAAGRGDRLKAGTPKAFAPYGDETILSHALRCIRACGEPLQVVIVVPPGRIDDASGIASEVFDGSAHTWSVVAGDATRERSVAAGLAAVPHTTDIVLIHDAARPDAPASLFDEVIAHVRRTGHGAVPVLHVVDSLTRVSTDDRILDTVDRESVRSVQTPQGFPATVLRRSFNAVDWADDASFTDDAGIVLATGGLVDAIPGSHLASKITYPHDLDRTPSEAPTLLTGIGVDVHRFADVGSGVLRLAGIDWPEFPPLAGHSDGDVVLHAICDSLLSAARLGDLGTQFGTSRPDYAGVDSAVFVTRTLELLREADFTVVNVAVEIIGERPRLAQRRTEAEDRLRKLLGARVSLGATTTDRLGFLGSAEGVAAIASALIRSTRSSSSHG